MNVDAVDAQASVLMNRGIRLMEQAEKAAIEEAVRCFDEARELREQLPFSDHPALCYGLAACWLNRGEALSRLEQYSAAVAAYERGIALMRSLPLGEDVRYPKRLAIALQNMGIALTLSGSRKSERATDVIREAIALLTRDDLGVIPDRKYLLAAAWLNVANLLVSSEDAGAQAESRTAAANAIECIADLETGNVNAAEAGLRARHVFCQSLAARLAQLLSQRGPLPEEVHEATDMADEGLALVRQWEKKGVDRFRAIAFDLFRFGGRVYAIYQPQFLNEFLRENLDPEQSSEGYSGDPGMRAAAEELRGFASSVWVRQ